LSSLDTPSSVAARQASTARIHPGTTIGAVRLTVSDLARSQDFYTRELGLQSSELDSGDLGIGVAGEHPLIELHGDPLAPRLDRHATGLYHLAILVPSRRDLAFALARLAEARWPLDGASDHLVSEALYLSDPDGNGIEIYRDRAREEWRYEGENLSMATLPLDLDSVLGELTGARELQRQAPAGTRIGHVHLQVSDIAQAEDFYAGVLGFDVTVRGYPGALFVSAGGYDHHIGLNTWHSAGATSPTPGSVGLRSFDVLLPGSDEVARTLERLKAAGIPIEQDPAGALIRDPAGNAIVLRNR
jgi:catechol 2,3-dioxygenase